MTPARPPWRGRLLDLARSRLAHNAIALYAAYVANTILPLITVPYLARVLGPSRFGEVAFAQAFMVYVILLVEFGFNLSATREVARHPDDREALGDLLASVLGARLLLTLLAVGGALLARYAAPVFRDHPAYLWLALGSGVAQALRPTWLFQGLERLKVVASLDVATRALATLGLLLLVRHAADGWRVLALQGGAAVVTTLVAFVLAYRAAPLRWPRRAGAARALRMGGAIFLYRSAFSLYSVTNTVLLAFLATPAAVGYYAGADKLIRALIGLLDPLTQALYPRASRVAHASRAQAARVARLATALMGLAGGLMAAAVFVGAPLLIRLGLGASYGPSVETLRIMALLPLLIGLSTPLTYQWMLPLGLDRVVVALAFLTGAVNLALAFAFTPTHAQNGMAAALVCAEAFVVVAIVAVLQRRGLNPLARGQLRGALAVEP